MRGFLRFLVASLRTFLSVLAVWEKLFSVWPRASPFFLRSASLVAFLWPSTFLRAS